jgi:4-amino-4-deoxy-L-arabinose transferase-like glycosyltransferase
MIVFIGLWTILQIVALFTRPLLPIDETRYVSVAWEMWTRNDFLVPFLNGVPYSEKPPLLFWLIQFGWWLFGINEWWPRLISPAFALAHLILIIKLGRLLWPTQSALPYFAGIILFSSSLWILSSTAVMFDLMLSFFTLLALFAIVQVWYTESNTRWLLVGWAIGLGLLAKGPIILLYVLPPALFAPWWQIAKPLTHSKEWWYRGVVFSTTLGIGIALLWLIPALLRGGESYTDAILWKQNVDRMVHSFIHQHPFWWYLPLLPLIFFPWLLWLPIWQDFKSLRAFSLHSGVRLCLLWLGIPFGILSLISGKQAHYLVPLLPAIALLMAHRILSQSSKQYLAFSQWLPASVIIIIGVTLSGVTIHQELFKYPPTWLSHLTLTSGLILIAIGFIGGLWRFNTLHNALYGLGIMNLAIMVSFHLTILTAIVTAYDMHPIAQFIAIQQQQGKPFVHIEKYHGQYQFIGRLERPLPVIYRENAIKWAKKHPDGWAISYHNCLTGLPKVSDIIPYLRGYAVIWQSKELLQLKKALPKDNCLLPNSAQL